MNCYSFEALDLKKEDGPICTRDDVWILGIYMTRFGKHSDKDDVDLASEAVLGAMADAGAQMMNMDVVAAGNVFGTGDLGQQIQKQLGQTGVPVYNVLNACATGATALRVVSMAIKSGEAEMGLAVGAEKLAGRGLLKRATSRDDDGTWKPEGRFGAVLPTDGLIGTETMPGIFAQIGVEYEYLHGGTSFDLFARISEKNHAHSTLNPFAAYQKRLTVDEIMNDVMVAYPNTRPMCSANSDGAAAAVLTSERVLRTLSLEQQRRAVKISASVMTTDPWQEACQVLPVNTLTRNAATQAYEKSGIGPGDLDLVELHDCFATAELVHYENLMLCPEGEAVDFFNSGATWRDGAIPVNVSGGLESKGHPLAATGIASLWEIATQLRGEAGSRQIKMPNQGWHTFLGLAAHVQFTYLKRRPNEHKQELRR